MENKKVVPTWVSILLLIICIIGIVLNIYTIIAFPGVTFSVEIIAKKILEAVTYVLAIFYCVTGYKKSSAKYFELFCVSAAVLMLTSLLSKTLFNNANAEVLYITCLAIAFGMLCTFALAKNLGKKKSYIMAIVILVCALINVLLWNSLIIILAMLITRFFLFVVFFIMIYAKYKDKEARGTT